MKKIAFGVLSLSVLIGAAFAEGDEVVYVANPGQTERSEVLTTKDYVDDGLRYVYGLKADKESVFTKEESDERYIRSVDFAEMDTTAYTGQNGVAVEGHNVKLNVAPSEGSMYVYTSDGWTELEVQDEWSADIFNPVQSGD